MQLEPVDSSNIESIGFELIDREMQTGDLYIKFKSGQTFRYLDFPREKHTAMMDAKSKGSYFARFVRKKYRGELVETEQEELFDEYGVSVGKIPGVKDKRTDTKTCGRCGQKFTAGTSHTCPILPVRTGRIDL